MGFLKGRNLVISLNFDVYDFNIGRDTENADYNHRAFSGAGDDVRIYTRALSESEIQQLYSGSSCDSNSAVVQAANSNWIDTGFSVQTGDRLFVTTTGMIRICCGSSPLDISPDGKPPANDNAFPGPSLPAYALIGKVGQNGAPFFVGSSYTGNATTSGELYLIVNDGVHADNTGSFCTAVFYRQ